MIVALLVIACILLGFATVGVFLIGAGLVDEDEVAEYMTRFYAERDQ